MKGLRRNNVTCGTENEYIDCQKSAELENATQPDILHSSISTQVTQCQNIDNQVCNDSMSKEYIACDETDDLVIEKTGVLDASSIQECMPEGRRIVDISFMWNEIHRTFDNHARGVECQFKDWKLVNSRRRGLLTQLFFKCEMCHYEDSIWSERTDSAHYNVNAAAVVGTVTTGIGHFQLEELCAAINIPCMSQKAYIKHRDELVDDFEETALQNMKAAGEAEKQLAVERNETINGIPYITVVADGSWMKRSYGTAYDSLSGVGAIIGFRTGKVLFIGIRNKYCAICDMAEKRNIEPTVHKCYKNFDRYATSTSMESDAIVEGFQKSIEMHGLIYKTVVADGDSNVYQSIIDNRPYREHLITVKKVECTNHLLRNLCKKLKIVADTTQPKTQRKRGFVQVRKVVKDNVLTIRKEVLQAAATRREENLPHHLKAVELQKDILNIPSHVFNEHKRCKERGRICVCNDEKERKNYVPFLKVHGLFDKVQQAVAYLSGHSDSLLLNLTNNPAEAFNSIICKEIGGKRIHFGKRGSYNARIARAVLQYNTQEVLSQLHERMHNDVPSVMENLEKRRQAKVARTRESAKVDGRKKKVKRESGTDSYYGPRSQKPDVPEHVLEQLRQNHLNKLIENAENCKEIERATIEQNESELWQSLRREILTASNFGPVCRMRPTTSCAVIVKNILFPPSIDTVAMKYGRDNEKIAREHLSKMLQKNIKICGLFINKEHPCLGASPDGTIDDDGLVEIKCPSSAQDLSAEEAIKTLPQLKNIFDKKNYEKMNRNHRYFYQVQGQLNIAQRSYCIFAIWTPKSLKMVHVTRDHDFWKDRMLPLLTRFYYECMLPEILDSRHNRHMPIRNPTYILKAKEEACKMTRRSHNANNIDEENITALLNDVEENDDCVIVSHSTKINWTADEVAKRREILDNMTASLNEVKENVLPMDSKLNDDSLNLLLRIIRESTSFETQSVLYIECTSLVESCRTNQSLQIVGGNCIDHWRCYFFNGTTLHVYDSIPGCTYERLCSKEKQYIERRYPGIKESNIIFDKVIRQPDGTSCGLYAAAFATTIALGGDPCNENYLLDVKRMRHHFFKIVESKQLLPFPTD